MGRTGTRAAAITAGLFAVAVVAVLAVLELTWRTSSLVTVLEIVGALVVGGALVVAVTGGRTRSSAAAPAGVTVPPGDVAEAAPLAERTAATLRTLDRIEHRRLELAASWPKVVVGPSGVVLVDVCAEAVGSPAGSLEVDDEDCAGRARLRDGVRVVREVLDGAGVRRADGRAPVPVRAVLVGPPGTATGDAGDGVAIDTAAVDRLVDVLARGPVLRMRTVDRAFAALSAAPALVAPTDQPGPVTRTP